MHEEILSIWCELQQICGFEYPDEPQQKPKTCKHVFKKGWKANTECKVKVKGDADYCSKHKKGDDSN